MYASSKSLVAQPMAKDAVTYADDPTISDDTAPTAVADVTPSVEEERPAEDKIADESSMYSDLLSSSLGSVFFSPKRVRTLKALSLSCSPAFLPFAFSNSS